ncbi:MAG: HisA/HisF-related TIM barrel protein [Candidatus Hodarchaeales archaeon]|jgi:phosphoribosylformimino-5-aminoimidazole carboxamide ribotide isomerase
MKIIPVLDIKGGKVVKGQGGLRDEYKPLKTTILLPPSKASEPLLLLQTLEKKLGFKEFYVADLDSIEGKGDNVDILESLRANSKANILLDAGIRRKSDVSKVPDGFIAVVASETLLNYNLLSDLVEILHPTAVWFSLDLKKGHLIAPEGSNLPSAPTEAADLVAASNIAGLLAIELDRVGQNTGPNSSVVQKITKNLSIPVYWGGGVRNLEDLRDLEALNCSGCLISSALHSGSIRMEQLNEFSALRD